jgi:hypothetical protein
MPRCPRANHVCWWRVEFIVALQRTTDNLDNHHIVHYRQIPGRQSQGQTSRRESLKSCRR